MLKKRLSITGKQVLPPKLTAVSVIGPSHVRKGIPNQDACLVRSKGTLHLAVVSDGVGSCPLSHIGSRCLCEAVSRVVFRSQSSVLNPALIFDAIRDDWLRQIKPLTYRAASATCLFALSNGKHVFVAMLGDGAIGLLHGDGVVEVLSENKSTAFSNITNSMTERTRIEEWQYRCYPVGELYGVMLATDGVADDLSLPEDFVKEILHSVNKTGTLLGRHHMREMLINWPVPKHSDDKTIACMIF